MKNFKKLAAAIGITAGAVTLASVANKIIFHLSTVKKLLVSDDCFIYEWRFGDIYYIKKGQGSPLVLLHDLSSVSSSYEWHKMIDRLAKKHTVYAIDLLGCGYSQKPKMTYTNYLYVQMLNEFVKEVIKGKTDVISSVSSCSVAMIACHIAPELYHTLMFINPENPTDIASVPKFHHKLYKYMIETPVIGTLIYNIQITANTIGKIFREKYYMFDYMISEEEVAAYNEAAHMGGSSSRYLYASICSRYLNIPVFQAVKQIDQSMVIVGGSGVYGIEDTIKVYTDLNPAIEHVIIENAKYMPQLEVPEKLDEIINIYL